MDPMVKFESTHPAPVVVAEGAVHLFTAFILFNWCMAVRALVRPYDKCPVLVDIYLSLLAGFAHMPLQLAVEAESVLALVAGDFTLLGSPFDHIFTARERTKFLVIRHTNFQI